MTKQRKYVSDRGGWGYWLVVVMVTVVVRPLSRFDDRNNH